MLDVDPAVPDLLLDEGVGRASRPSALKELRIGPVGDLEPRSCSVQVAISTCRRVQSWEDAYLILLGLPSGEAD